MSTQGNIFLYYGYLLLELAQTISLHHGSEL